MSQVAEYNVRITETGEQYNETIEVDTESQTEVFKVPAHNNVQHSNVMNDFKMVSLWLQTGKSVKVARLNFSVVIPSITKCLAHSCAHPWSGTRESGAEIEPSVFYNNNHEWMLNKHSFDEILLRHPGLGFDLFAALLKTLQEMESHTFNSRRSKFKMKRMLLQSELTMTTQWLDFVRNWLHSIPSDRTEIKHGPIPAITRDRDRTAVHI